jgi:hypothetical protein
VKLTIHTHVVSRLRHDTAVPLLPLCNFMAWTGANLILSFKCRIGGGDDERDSMKCTKFFNWLRMLCGIN